MRYYCIITENHIKNILADYFNVKTEDIKFNYDIHSVGQGLNEDQAITFNAMIKGEVADDKAKEFLT